MAIAAKETTPLNLRRSRGSGRPLLFIVSCLLVCTPVAVAHPMGNFSVNHYAKIDLQRDRITIRYVIDLAEIPAYQEMQEAGIQPEANDPAVSRYIAKRGRELAGGLILTLNGETLPLRTISSGVLFPPGAGGLPTMKMGFVYEAAWPARIERTHARLRYADDNYAGHTGWKEIVAVAASGTLLSSSVPATDRSDELNNYPTDLLNSPPQVLEATLEAALPAPSEATKAAKDQSESQPAQVPTLARAVVPATTFEKSAVRAI